MGLDRLYCGYTPPPPNGATLYPQGYPLPIANRVPLAQSVYAVVVTPQSELPHVEQQPEDTLHISSGCEVVISVAMLEVSVLY